MLGFPLVSLTGLAAGAQATRTYTSGCGEGTHEGRADSLNQVPESDETNNVRVVTVIC